MLLELIAIAAAAVGAAGVVMLLRKLSGGRLPRWFIPATAGAAMLSYAIWSEYSWYDRVSSGLPDGLEVVASDQGGAPWRPWSYVFPVTERFIAIDRRSIVDHAAAQDQRFFNAYWFERWMSPRITTLLVDCGRARGYELPAGADFPVNIAPADDAWIAIPANDPLFEAACREA